MDAGRGTYPAIAGRRDVRVELRAGGARYRPRTASAPHRTDATPGRRRAAAAALPLRTTLQLAAGSHRVPAIRPGASLHLAGRGSSRERIAAAGRFAARTDRRHDVAGQSVERTV